VVCRALGRIGPPAREAVSALTLVAKEDTDAGVRRAAAEAVRKIKAGLRRAAWQRFLSSPGRRG
jgi:hypothetical protein